MFAVHTPAGAQQQLSRRYTVKDGLASNTVYAVLVDNRGFLWFATDLGVSFYDGTRFTNYSVKDGLADNDVLSMFQDDEGRIWFICFNKRPCFYFKGRFYNASNFPELQKIKDYNWHIVYSGTHEVWFSGTDAIYRFAANKVKVYQLANAPTIRLISRIGSAVYFLNDSRLYHLNEQSGKATVIEGMDLKAMNAGFILDVGDGNFVIAEHPDIKHTFVYRSFIDPEHGRWDKKLCGSYDKEVVNCLLDQKRNVLRMIFTDNTVTERDLRTNDLRTLHEYTLNWFVSDFNTDLQGNKWFTLLHRGVQMFPKTRSTVVAVPDELQRTSTYYSIIGYGGRIIVGNNDNTLLLINKGRMESSEHESLYSKNNRVVDMKADKDNRIWLGMDNGVSIFDPKSRKFEPRLSQRDIKDIKYDRKNDAMLFASSTGSFYMGCRDGGRISFINHERTTSIAGSITDTCWYATLGGLFMFDGKVSVAERELSSQLNSRVTCLELDSMGQLWIGTFSNGVFVVKQHRIIHHFTVAEGMTSNICKNMLVAANGDAWVCTNLGISHIWIRGSNYQITRYNDRNYLVDNNVNDVLVSGDTVYAVSSTGIAFFNKKDVSDAYSFPVYITGLKLAGKDMVPEDSAFSVRSKQHTISISFSGLSYLSNGQIRYEYYIEELTDKPQSTTNSTVTFSGLAPGTYNFYVSATDIFGNRSSAPAHIQFTIVPEWYELLWLRLVVAVSVLLMLLWFTFRYSRRIEQRRRLQSELNQTISRLELEAIRLQINPHFIFNCLNAIQNSIYEHNADRASYFISRFAKLMRKALMLSKESFITVDEEYDFLNNYLEVEQLRHNHSFDYSIKIAPAVNRTQPVIPAFVLQPFIENAINHGLKYLKTERGNIELSFSGSDRLVLRLEDNGIGIDASKEIHRRNSSKHTSRGIELMLARVESLNKIYNRNIAIAISDRQHEGGQAHGTLVIITLDYL
jgi:hypothetical protein